MLVACFANLIACGVVQIGYARNDDPAAAGLPCGKLEFGVLLQLMINIFVGCGAEPQGVAFAHNEAEGANAGLVAFAGCQVPCGYFGKVFNDVVHGVPFG